jgi:hypothetical protein
MKVTEEMITKNISDKKIVQVKLKDISTRDVNPRKTGLIMENVEKLMSAGEFPEIHLGYWNNELIIVDGYHRFSATQRLEKTEISAYITEFETLEDIKKQAFLANVKHGIMLSELDIALNIYEFYLIEVSKKKTAKILDIIKQYEIPERRGRILFYWSVFNREVLGNNINVLKEPSRFEDYNRMLNKRNEVIGQISESFKEEFKIFYDKYDYLPCEERRKAIRLYNEGKDYDEELEKEEEARRFEELQRLQEEELAEQIEEEAETCEILTNDYIGDDAVERNANVSYVNSISNQTMKELKTQAEELKTKLEEKAKVTDAKLESVSNIITDVADKFMRILILQNGNKVKISRNDYETLQNIADLIGEILMKVDEENFEEKREMI